MKNEREHTSIYSCEQWDVCYPSECIDGTRFQRTSCAKSANEISYKGFEYKLSYRNGCFSLDKIGNTWFISLTETKRYKICCKIEPYIDFENSTDFELYQKKTGNREIISTIKKMVKNADTQKPICENCQVVIEAFIRDMYTLTTAMKEEICKITNEQRRREIANEAD